MRSDTEQRPGSADTMVLILKPREEDYKQVSPQFPGTKNEQQAYRKYDVGHILERGKPAGKTFSQYL
ncbi:hypothetical protein Bpfe_013770 [Biomphalaria pfeifferi]|uniref:Uncharacterized protein n=1 Tax=Biomphalaria pfeifferi TaxID=112525 RepID=A0AAD8BLH9_BIOPF|nr:hypothetical protein Bpfe_013770 [Biomphalaria pfeifferi]